MCRTGRQADTKAQAQASLKLKLRAHKLKLKLKVCWKKRMVREECNKRTSFAAQWAQQAV